MDETLLHVDHKRPGVVAIRPNCRQFMIDMAKLYEIVIFTCGLKDYADFCLAKLDPKNEWITHRLYRDSCTHFRGSYYKDLSRIDRDLSKTFIVDNWPENFAAQPENGLHITSWMGNHCDQALKKLIPTISSIVKN